MTLHFRALCKVIDRLCFSIRKQHSASTNNTKQKKISLDLVDKADSLTKTIGGLSDKLAVGTDLDLTGRMIFRFQSALKKAEPQTLPQTMVVSPERGGRMRSLSEDMVVFRSTTRLTLVLDPKDMFVVKPAAAQMEENRGTVLCTVSLRSVIAAAADGEWLHVAVRHEDVGFLIKNGKWEGPLGIECCRIMCLISSPINCDRRQHGVEI
jgi:hypothetical protein